MLIIGNWKVYVDSRTKAKALYATAKRLAAKGGVTLGVAPAFPYLALLAPTRPLKRAPHLVAQDVSITDTQAETGEVPARALKDLGVSHVIVGHSERRARGESDVIIAEKVRRVLAQGITPVLCVGETARDEDAQYLSQVRMQIHTIYGAIEVKQRSAMVLAYEPVWAIGTGKTITPSDLAEMILYIRKVLAELLPDDGAQRVVILYGGSVDASSVRVLADDTGIGGFLVGRASADSASFTALVNAASKLHA